MWIVCQFLTCSVNCQITTNDKYICLDSTAARKVLKATYERDNYKNEIALLTEIQDNSDNLIQNQQKVITLLKNSTDSLVVWKNKYYNDMGQATKQKKWLGWGIKASLLLTLLVAIIK